MKQIIFFLLLLTIGIYATSDPTTADSTTAESTTAETTTAASTTAESTTAASTTAESTTAESTTAESTTAESTTAETTTAESTTAESTTAESTTTESTTAESTTAQSTTAESTTTESNGGELIDPDTCTKDDADRVIGCTDDCTSRKFCLNGEIKNIKCPKTSLGLSTYCNSVNRECDRQSKCENENVMLCPGKGTYPHLLDCHKVFMCKEKGEPGLLKSCGTLKKYDPASGRCVNVNICYNFSPIFGKCLGKHEQIVAHPQNSKLYVHCHKSGPTLGSCADGYVFNAKSLVCEFKCPKSGLYIDSMEPKCYFKCTWSFFKYRYERKCCKDDEVFNDSLKMCGPDVTRKLQIG